MNKQEFIDSLKLKLSLLPKKEVDERISFYSEIIADYIEDGLTESEALRKIGSVDDIATQITSEIPLTKIARERIKPNRRLKTSEILLITIGSPIWIALLVSLFAVVASLYLSLWAVIISCWAVFISLTASSFAGILSGLILIFGQNRPYGLFLLSSGLICFGLAILSFYGCKILTLLTIKLTKKMILSLKKFLVKKEKI